MGPPKLNCERGSPRSSGETGTQPLFNVGRSSVSSPRVARAVFPEPSPPLQPALSGPTGEKATQPAAAIPSPFDGIPSPWRPAASQNPSVSLSFIYSLPLSPLISRLSHFIFLLCLSFVLLSSTCLSSLLHSPLHLCPHPFFTPDPEPRVFGARQSTQS